jgi:hypothetical protein
MCLSALALVSCSNRASDVSSKPEKGPDSEVKNSQEDAAKETWVFKVKKDGFSLRFPKGWKQSKRELLSFYSLGSGSPMLASVKKIQKQTLEEFKKTASTYRDFVRTEFKRLQEFKVEEGKTTSGDPYEYIVIHEKGHDTSTYFYIASSHIWLSAEQLTVQVFFEGQGKMLSNVFQAREHETFENEARTILLSPAF